MGVLCSLAPTAAETNGPSSEGRPAVLAGDDELAVEPQPQHHPPQPLHQADVTKETVRMRQFSFKR